MTRLSDLKDSMLIKDKQLCLGEVWHNERMELLVKDVKSVKFNLELVQWCKDVISDKNGIITMHTSNRLTKGQIIKLNSIMKAKSKATLQKRVYSLSNLFTNSFSQSFFERDRNEAWVKFCNEHGLDSGLVKVNRVKQTEKIINSMINNL